ncbi:protein adenylyltransferase Fic [Hydra vulgaris]|uniref:protein adenylyltransferase n=1 Tax=Hydra vulgaris TaxID=6087 RepID=A0ABM4BHM9_HYDVU
MRWRKTLVVFTLLSLLLVSYVMLKVAYNRIIFWLNDNKYPNRTSLALLTITDEKHEVFDANTILQRDVQNEGVALEANIIMQKAISLYHEGDNEKAIKLLKHCKSLTPRNPDVLNAYGEVIEPRDIIDADHHYALALVIYPGHLRAKENKNRCSSKVKAKDMEMLQRIESKRLALTEIPEGNAALNRAKLEAYYRHIYHTNGIEGNTLTLSMTRAILETGMAVGGKSILEHNEVLGMDLALKYINVTLVNEPGPVNLEHILQIHKRVLGYTHPLDAGLYRQEQVYVGDHIPPNPLDMVKYLDAFQKWLSSIDITLLHPIEMAALSHYKLVYIHPFIDGNGRTSRLLMNLFLMRAGYPPVIIRKEQRYEYYELLQTANMGDVRPFIRFVARCTEDTLDEYLSSVTVRQLNSDSDSSENGAQIMECFNPFNQASSLTQEHTYNTKCAKLI